MISSTSNAANLIEPKFPRWQPASWQDYLACRDNVGLERVRLFFNQGYLFVDMGSEGINHASISDLFPILFFLWFRKRGQPFKSCGRCLLEKANYRAASPDQVIYIGGNYPQGREGEPRRINLNEWRVPDLVGEVADTTLATDLDEKKHLYAGLGVPEYWVVDVEGGQVLTFQLQDGRYQQCEVSNALQGLPIRFLEATIQQLSQGSTDSAASYFAEQIEAL